MKRYEDLFFTDDFLFCKIMTHNESICRRVIEVLLGFEVESLTYVNKQETLQVDYAAHGIRLDVIAKSSGKLYDIEMQTTLEGDLPKRARYYQALMDLDCLDAGQAYDTLPESYIVFISTEDPFGGGLPRYTVKLQCLENADLNEKISDKTLKLYYNAKEWAKLLQVNAEAQSFLKFLTTHQTTSPLTEEIMEAVETARVHEPWRKEFFYVRELEKRGRRQGLEEGMAKQRAADQAIIDQLRAENEAMRKQLESVASPQK